MTGPGVVFGPPKTEASTRTVAVADVVLDAIRDQAATYGAHRSGLVFTSAVGSPVATSTLQRAWSLALAKVNADRAKAAKKCGTVASPLDVTPHDLRHYFASMHIRSGTSIKALQALLGHKSAVETWDTYGHLVGDEDDRTRAVIQGALGKLSHGRATGKVADLRSRRSEA